MIQKQPPKKAFYKLQQIVRYPGPLREWFWNTEVKQLERWGTMLMNCKSPLPSFNVKGSCKSFLNLHLCFVHMQGLAANPAGPQDIYTTLCKRNYENRDTWREKYICLLMENNSLKNSLQLSTEQTLPPQTLFKTRAKMDQVLRNWSSAVQDHTNPGGISHSAWLLWSTQSSRPTVKPEQGVMMVSVAPHSFPEAASSSSFLKNNHTVGLY